MFWMHKILSMFLLIFSATSFGASDGNLDHTSNGNILINISKGYKVGISGFSDINFGDVTKTPEDKFIDVCIYSTTGSYDVTPTSENPHGSQFQLSNADKTDYIKYRIEWNNTASGDGGTKLNSGSTSPRFSGANTSSEDCDGNKNARLFVAINNRSFTSASSGTYSDTLTLVVSPR